MHDHPTNGYAQRLLTRAQALAEAAEQHVSLHALTAGDLLASRLAPDMLNLERQFQILVDGVRGGMTRLAGLHPPEPEDPAFAVFNRGDDRDFAEPAESFEVVIGRIKACKASIAALPPFPLEELAERTIDVQWRGTIRRFDGQNFLMHYVIPNAFFHLSMAYAILRHQGLPLGKQDFEGPASYEVITNHPQWEPEHD